MLTSKASNLESPSLISHHQPQSTHLSATHTTIAVPNSYKAFTCHERHHCLVVRKQPLRPRIWERRKSRISSTGFFPWGVHAYRHVCEQLCKPRRLKYPRSSFAMFSCKMLQWPTSQQLIWVSRPSPGHRTHSSAQQCAHSHTCTTAHNAPVWRRVRGRG